MTKLWSILPEEVFVFISMPLAVAEASLGALKASPKFKISKGLGSMGLDVGVMVGSIDAVGGADGLRDGVEDGSIEIEGCMDGTEDGWLEGCVEIEG
mmetsp:Transcript_28309/g.58998  ORF Transcript_28309/g.58998 Transcript_28309/m.58998 type:complete len:97 (-) Transcript_28309:91-381(-)